MHCYRIYTPLWLWYWPWVHNNVLQRIAWGKKIHLHSKAVRRQGRRLSEQKPRRVQPRRRERELGARPSEIGQKTLWKAWRAKLRSYGMCHGEHARDVGLHAQECGWARDVTRITGRRLWSRYGESPRWTWWRTWGMVDVRATALGCPGDLRAVAVPGEFCVIKNRLRARLTLCRVIPQQINKPVTVVETLRRICAWSLRAAGSVAILAQGRAEHTRPNTGVNTNVRTGRTCIVIHVRRDMWGTRRVTWTWYYEPGQLTVTAGVSHTW